MGRGRETDTIGFTLRHIPELLTSDPGEPAGGVAPVQEFIDEQQRFLDGLSRTRPGERWHLQLRVGYRQGAGVAFLLAQSPHIGEATDDSQLSFVRHLLPRGIPWDDIDGDSASRISDWADRGKEMSVVEVRRRAEQLGNIEVPLPFRTHHGLFAQTLRALSRDGSEGYIIVTLEPAALSEAAHRQVLNALNQLRPTSDSADPSDGAGASSVDPTAVWRDLTIRRGPADAAICYLGTLLSRERHLFTMRVFVAVADGDVESIGRVLGSELTLGEDPDWPRGVSPNYRVIQSRYESALPAWTQTERSTSSDRSPLEDLIAHLATPEDAIQAFRVPVAVRGKAFPMGFSVQNEPFPAPSAIPQAERIVHLGALLDYGQPTARPVGISLNVLNQHALIFGTSGSGKTRTLLRLVTELWATNGVPFIVVDPKPSERSAYRQLLRCDAVASQLKVFTVGREWPSPLRINPLALSGSEVVEEHKRRLAEDLLEALPRYSTLRSALLSAVDRVYSEAGMSDSDQRPDQHLVPDLSTLRDAISRTIRSMEGLKADDRSQWHEVVMAHLRPLVTGSLGRTLSSRPGHRISDFMNVPVLIEIDLPPYERAVVLMFLLGQIFTEARTRVSDGNLVHVTVVDEIHRILQPFEFVDRQFDGNPAQRVLRMVEDGIETLREYGEALVVAGQTPDSLSEPIIANTNVKIEHRLAVGAASRRFGEAMGLGVAQLDRIHGLGDGEAITYVQARGGPYLMHTAIERPLFDVDNSVIRDEDIARHMGQDTYPPPETPEEPAVRAPNESCGACPLISSSEGCFRPALTPEDTGYYRQELGDVWARGPSETAWTDVIRRIGNGLAGSYSCTDPHRSAICLIAASMSRRGQPLPNALAAAIEAFRAKTLST